MNAPQPNPDDPRCPICKDTGEIILNARPDWDSEGMLWGACSCPAGVEMQRQHDAEAERHMREEAARRSKATFDLYNPNRAGSTLDHMLRSENAYTRESAAMKYDL